ncbi:MAG: 50S ribosomal protein L13 [Spirochaetales bacterium]|nr:50S ribosomal protein L13 [Spirochaetales bacterium]HNQ98076.1 50S ribosomal protein L13 [Treponemataceae bacterium]
MKTLFVKEHEAPRSWFVIDAQDKPIGRIAAKAASMLRGKHKVTYAPNQETGDYIVIINAEKAVLSGTKTEDKMYRHHTGFVGGLRSVSYAKLLERHPSDPILLAIKGMLPKGPLGRKMLTNVKVYAGTDHPHAAQNPQAVEV